ncbi:MAG: RagB/SusD family nutrient uptake outer membrane protein [Ginsengibacter sp.]
MKFNFWKIIILFLGLSVITHFACKNSKLDLLPHGPTEQSYFTQESDFTKAVLGVYAKMSDFFWYHGDPYSGLYTIFYLPGDDITVNDNEEFEQFGSLQPSSGRISEFYSVCYQMIARANVVLQKVNEVADGIYTTPNLKQYHKGEALFLRGFANYYLWNYFGTAPLDTARVTTSAQFTPPNSTATELLDQAINDFSEAATLLPASWGASNVGRATTNAANGLLGKCLVFRASATKSKDDYTAAIAAFNKITGVSLVPDFEDNFSWQTENNSESIFEFQASQAFALDNIWLPNDFDNAIGSISAYYGFYDNDGGTYAGYGKSRFYATTKLLNAFDPADPRLDLTMNPTDRTVRKYVLNNKSTQAGGGSVNNTRLLRYADVLLLKAEAIIQSGGSAADAIGLVNQVRTRARNMVSGGTEPADYSTSQTNAGTVMNWIMNERLIELGGEGQRWFDLRRWQMEGIISLDNNYFSSNTNTMSFQLPKHLNFPIPNSEIDVNPNVHQNDGY